MVSTWDLLDWTRPCCPYLAGCSDSPRAGAPVLELSPHPQELDPLCVLPAQPSPHISGFAYPCGPLGTQLLGPKCCHRGSFVPWPRDGGPGMLTWDAALIQPASATQETFRHNAVCPASQGPALHSGPTGRVPRRGMTGGDCSGKELPPGFAAWAPSSAQRAASPWPHWQQAEVFLILFRRGEQITAKEEVTGELCVKRNLKTGKFPHS